MPFPTRAGNAERKKILQHLQTIFNCTRQAWTPAVKSTLWLLRLMIPITLAVRLMDFYGVISWMAQYLDPMFIYIGLPGYAAIAFLTGAFVTTYAGLAVMLSMVLTLREATIVGTMICICHALLLESAVIKKTGSSFWRMAMLRMVMAFVCGFYLNLVLPQMPEAFMSSGDATIPATLTALLTTWLWSTLKMSAMIFLLIYCLMIIQRMLEAYGLTEKISHVLSPIMKFFGLPQGAAYMWVVGNVLGISYGSAVMLDLEEQGHITREEANDVNYHLIMNHSMLEDTLVFALSGVSALWILSTRMLFALLLVWGRKALKAMTVR